MKAIFTPEDKKVLRFVSKVLNSYGMDDGSIETEGFDVYDLPDLSTYDVESFTHFSNNYTIEVPPSLFPIIKKVFLAANKKMDEIDYEEDINYGRIDFDIDTEAQEVSVNYWYSFYERGDYNSQTIDASDEEDVTKILEEIAPLAHDTEIMELSYNGSGDSGYIEGNFENSEAVPASIEDFCYRWLENSHGGWEINEGSQGQFIFNLKDMTITLEHQMNYEETRSHTLFEESFAK